MSEYIHLVGAEKVQQAGYDISNAAEQMRQSANWLIEAMAQQRDFLNDWLGRYEAAMEKAAKRGEHDAGV